jgi:hypothetical protein
MMREIIIDLDTLSQQRFKAMLERLRLGFPLLFKESRQRDAEKRAALIKFYIDTTPPADDILTGKAFTKVFAGRQ